MRQLFTSVLVICAVASPAARQPARGGAGSAAVIRACSLLTRDVVTRTSPYEKQALDLVLRIPPMEDVLGAAGSACSYGGVTLQIDPFTPATIEKQRDKTWMALPGIGETAFFRDNKGRWAELYVHDGAHVLTIQMDVPTGRSTESIKPNVLALAETVLPKLK
jgi:hypothetical protein